LKKMMWGPAPWMRFCTEAFSPRTSEVIPTTAMMPMKTPSTVSVERSLLTRSVATAMRRFSITIRPADLLIAKRLDRIQPRGAIGGDEADDGEAPGHGDERPDAR